MHHSTWARVLNPWKRAAFWQVLFFLLMPVEEMVLLLLQLEKRKKVKSSNFWEGIAVIGARQAGIDPRSLQRNRIHNRRCTSVMPTNGTAVSSATPITHW